jgi:succinate dehydrogenase hydrophobic anchor subunit
MAYLMQVLRAIKKDYKTPMKVMHFLGMMLVLMYVPCCAGVGILDIKP